MRMPGCSTFFLLAALASGAGLYRSLWPAPGRPSTVGEARIVASSSDPRTYFNGFTTDGAYFYITAVRSAVRDEGLLLRVPVSGGAPLILYSGYPHTKPLGAVVIGDYLYWIDCNSGPVTQTQVFRAPKDGGGPVQTIFTGKKDDNPLADASGLTTDGRDLFIVDEAFGRVVRMSADGKRAAELARRYGSVPGNPFYSQHRNTIALHNGRLYIADAGGGRWNMPPAIVSMDLNGGSRRILWQGPPLISPQSITAAGDLLYVGDGGARTLWTIPTQGGIPRPLATGWPRHPLTGLVMLGESLYLTDSPAPDQPGEIRRVELRREGNSHTSGLPWAASLALSLLGLVYCRSTRAQRWTARRLRRILRGRPPTNDEVGLPVSYATSTYDTFSQKGGQTDVEDRSGEVWIDRAD
jgi:hypothetical protein